LQGETPDHSPANIIKFRDRAGTIAFELIDLGKVGGIYEKKPGGCAHCGGEKCQQSKEKIPYQPPFAGFAIRWTLVDDFQWV
jgi:hypothetical protein